MVFGHKDSLSRANHAPNMFDVRSEPKKQQSLHVAVGSRDTLRNSRHDLLEQEISQRFHANNYQLPNERLIVIAKAGKLLFMAAAVPLYLTIYRIPKWFLLQAVPKLWKNIVDNNSKGLQAFKNLWALAIVQMSKLFRFWSWQKKRVDKTDDKNSSYFSFIKRGLEPLTSLANRAIALPKRLLQTLKAKGQIVVRQLKQQLKQKLQTLTEYVKQQLADKVTAPFHKHVTEPFARFRQRQKERVKAFVHALVHKYVTIPIARPLAAWYSNAKNLIQEKAANVRQKVEQWRHRAKKVQENLIDKWRSFYSNPKEYLQLFYNKATAAIKKTVRWDKLANVFAAFRRKSGAQGATLKHYLHKLATSNYSKEYNFFEAILALPLRKGYKAFLKVREGVQKAADTIKEVGRRTKAIINEAAATVSHVLKQLIPSHPLLNPTVWQQSIAALLFKKGKSAAGKGALSPAARVTAAIKTACVNAFDFFRQWSFKAWHQPKKVAARIKCGIAAAILNTRRTLYWLRILWAWLRVLIRYWLSLVPTTAHALIGKKEIS